MSTSQSLQKTQSIKLKETIIQYITVTKNIIDDCNEQLSFENKINTDMLMIASSAIHIINDESLITGFIHKTYPYWDKIIEKSKQYLCDYGETILHQYVTKEILNLYNINFSAYAGLLNDDVINQDDQNLLWDYLQSMVRISINHIHQQRSPTINSEGKKHYSSKYMVAVPNPSDNKNDMVIKLKKYAKLFDITLLWSQEK